MQAEPSRRRILQLRGVGSPSGDWLRLVKLDGAATRDVEVRVRLGQLTAASRSPKIVAVWRDGDGLRCFSPPCGRCRELIRQVDPAHLDTEMILGSGQSALLRERLPANDVIQAGSV